MSCKGCQERQVGCHVTCERYKEYRANLDKEKEARIQAHKVNEIVDDYDIRRIEKTKKALKRMKASKRKGNK